MGKSNRKSEGQYAPLPYPMLRSDAWRSLSGPAVKVLLELHTRFNGGNNGQLHLSMNEASNLLGIGKSSVQRAFRELEEKGFLALTRQGSWYHRKASEYRLTTKSMHYARGKEAPTHDWRSWRAPKTKRGPETGPSGSRMVPRQNPRDVRRPTTEPVRANSGRGMGPETGH